MTEHSRISPSASKRWLKCHGSVTLLDSIKRRPAGDAAQQGTAMHTVSEAILLSQDPGADHKYWKKQYVGVVVDDIEITDDHMDIVLEYVDMVCEYIARYPGCKVTVEHKGKWSQNVLLFGTIDLRIEVDTDVHILIIIDLKTGHLKVDPETATQLWIYALIAAGDKLHSYEEIHLGICQPKDIGNERKVHIISPAELHIFADEQVKPAIEGVFSVDPEFHPGEDQCRWCDAAPRCIALAEFNVNIAKEEFGDIEDILDDGPGDLKNYEHRLFTNKQIGKLLPHVELIVQWAKAIFTYAQEELEHGREVPGYKLVAGRSSRSWTMPEDQIVDYLTILGVDRDLLFVEKMITLPQTEKVFKKKKIGISLNQVTNKTPGKAKMAHESDKRPAMKSSAAEDFKDS